MAQERLDDLRMLAPFEESCGERVAQAVKSEALIGEPGSLEQRLELSVVDVVVGRGPPTRLGNTRSWSCHSVTDSLSSFCLSLWARRAETTL